MSLNDPCFCVCFFFHHFFLCVCPTGRGTSMSKCSLSSKSRKYFCFHWQNVYVLFSPIQMNDPNEDVIANLLSFLAEREKKRNILDSERLRKGNLESGWLSFTSNFGLLKFHEIISKKVKQLNPNQSCSYTYLKCWVPSKAISHFWLGPEACTNATGRVQRQCPAWG